MKILRWLVLSFLWWANPGIVMASDSDQTRFESAATYVDDLQGATNEKVCIALAMLGSDASDGESVQTHLAGSCATDSLFQIGSITKTFTGVLLADAVTRGDLALTTTLGKLFDQPAPAPATRPITVSRQERRQYRLNHARHCQWREHEQSCYPQVSSVCNGVSVVRKLLCLASLLVAFSASADNHCEYSEWGKNDEVGAANRITADSVLKASQLIKTGKTYSLGITIDSSTPAFAPRGLSLYVVQPNQQEGNRPFAGMTYNDDIFQGWLGIGSQIDGLGHLGEDGMYYNCNHAREFSGISGLTKLGIENVPPIVARGIVLDMAGHYGVDHMKAGQYFTVDDVKAVVKRQKTPIREGDVVLFHTGWTEAKLNSDPQAWVSGEPGQSEEVADYLASLKVVAVGADTWGVDVVPSQSEDKPFYGHVVYLKQNGIYIFETMNTGPLVRDEAFEFLFVLGQAKVRGAVQMIINPIAIR